jgi:hypothetical protein
MLDSMDFSRTLSLARDRRAVDKLYGRHDHAVLCVYCEYIYKSLDFLRILFLVWLVCLRARYDVSRVIIS